MNFCQKSKCEYVCVGVVILSTEQQVIISSTMQGHNPNSNLLTLLGF